MKKSPRSLRAIKGWKTRRANAAIRSQRARKGWVTRRANLRADSDRRERNRVRRLQSRKKSSVSKKDLEGLDDRAKQGLGIATKSEYAVSADYKARKRGSSVTVQISAIGPANATKQHVQDATAQKINTGRSPKEWEIRIIDWKGKRANQSTQGAWKAFSAPLALADFSIHKMGKA